MGYRGEDISEYALFTKVTSVSIITYMVNTFPAMWYLSKIANFVVTYLVHSTIKYSWVLRFWILHKTCRLRTQRGIDKASEYNGHTVFSLVWCQLCLIFYYLFFSSSQIAPIPLFSLTRASMPSPVPSGHAKAYDRFAPNI